MALYKSAVKRIATQTGMQEVLINAGCLFNYPDKQLDDFAQAIYALGVAGERERAMQVCFTHSIHSEDLANICAEAIRKGALT